MNTNTIKQPPSPRRPTRSKYDYHRFLSRRILISLVIAFLLAAGLYQTWALVFQSPPHRSASSGPVSEADRERTAGAEAASVVGDEPAAAPAVPTKAPSDPRWALLLLGYGGGGHDGAYLTDSMTLAIANPDQKTLTLLSLPRDCWVPLIFDGETADYNKLNTAYAFAKDTSLFPDRLAKYTGDNGAGTFTKDTVSRILGVPVSNYLALDFVGFRDMINTVGGIDVDVPDSFTARYPANDDPSIDPRWITVRFYKGLQHMNGERAIEYARAREVLDNVNEGNDFARSRRQRLIMESFKTRLFQAGGLIHLPQLLAIAGSHIDTDYAVPAIGQFSQFLLGWKDVRIYQTALTVGNYLTDGTGPGGTYALVPNNPDESWAPIQAFARRLWQDPETGIAMAQTRIVVENDTGQSGVAGHVSEVLAQLGYDVAAPITGSERAQSRLVNRTGGEVSLLSQQLEKDLGVTFEEVTETAGADSNDLVIELGSDDVGLASLAIPTHDDAPSSATGIASRGWSPEVEPQAATVPTTTIPITTSIAKSITTTESITKSTTISTTKPITVPRPYATPHLTPRPTGTKSSQSGASTRRTIPTGATATPVRSRTSLSGTPTAVRRIPTPTHTPTVIPRRPAKPTPVPNE